MLSAPGDIVAQRFDGQYGGEKTLPSFHGLAQCAKGAADALLGPPEFFARIVLLSQLGRATAYIERLRVPALVLIQPAETIQRRWNLWPVFDLLAQQEALPKIFQRLIIASLKAINVADISQTPGEVNSGLYFL